MLLTKPAFTDTELRRKRRRQQRSQTEGERTAEQGAPVNVFGIGCLADGTTTNTKTMAGCPPAERRAATAVHPAVLTGWGIQRGPARLVLDQVRGVEVEPRPVAGDGVPDQEVVHAELLSRLLCGGKG